MSFAFSRQPGRDYSSVIVANVTRASSSTHYRDEGASNIGTGIDFVQTRVSPVPLEVSRPCYPKAAMCKSIAAKPRVSSFACSRVNWIFDFLGLLMCSRSYKELKQMPIFSGVHNVSQ